GVAVVHQVSDGATFELQECRVAALCRTRLVPHAGRGAYAVQQSAADQSHNVEMMGALAEYHAATHVRVELGGQSRSIQPVIEIPAADHFQLADLPTADQLAHRPDWR